MQTPEEQLVFAMTNEVQSKTSGPFRKTASTLQVFLRNREFFKNLFFHSRALPKERLDWLDQYESAYFVQFAFNANETFGDSARWSAFLKPHALSVPSGMGDPSAYEEMKRRRDLEWIERSKTQPAVEPTLEILFEKALLNILVNNSPSPPFTRAFSQNGAEDLLQYVIVQGKLLDGAEAGVNRLCSNSARVTSSNGAPALPTHAGNDVLQYAAQGMMEVLRVQNGVSLEERMRPMSAKTQIDPNGIPPHFLSVLAAWWNALPSPESAKQRELVERTYTGIVESLSGAREELRLWESNRSIRSKTARRIPV